MASLHACLFAGAAIAAGHIALLKSTDTSLAQQMGALEPVGALHCAARRAQGAATTWLTCKLRLTNAKADQGTFEGEMFDEGLYLMAPAGTQVLWNVLAPRPIEASALAGDYDTVSRHRFEYELKKPNLLIGGRNDMVALELVAPPVDPINAATLLTLRQVN